MTTSNTLRRTLGAATILVLGLGLASGCSLVPTEEELTGNSNIVYLWIGANADAFTWCGFQTAGCPYGDANFGKNGTLPVAFTQLDLKRTYVHFDLPGLPDGTEVEEAYLELYHAGKNEDGRTDDINIPVATVPSAWDPMTITHNNQPFQQTPSGFTSIDLRSQAWSATPNIDVHVTDMFANPSTNFGFAVYWPTMNPPTEKGFYGINDIRRKRNDLGLSPRLLVKVVLPDGQTVADITLNPLLSSTDIAPAGSGPILMVRTASGGDSWPDSWDVVAGS